MARAGRARGADRAACRARRTSGRPGPSAPAGPARRCTSTAAEPSARRRRPARRRHRALPRVLEPRLHDLRAARGRRAHRPAAARHRHRARGSSAWRRSCRTSPRSSRPTSSRRSSSSPRRCRGAASATTTRTTRAMRIIADHSRGTANLIADGVVPSNEDRGYILRRIMRRAIQQGRVLGLEPPFLGASPSARSRRWPTPTRTSPRERDTIMRWVSDEERSFGRTLERGTELLDAADRRGQASRARPGSTRPTRSSSTTPTASPTT